MVQPALLLALLITSLLRAQGIASARQALERQDHARAERELLQVLKSTPKAAEAHFLLGVMYSQRGEHAKARASLLAALKLTPNSIAVLNNLGVNALARHAEAEAEGYFRKVLSLAPSDPDAGFNLGLIELKQRRFTQASEHLGRVAKARPDDLPVLQALLEAHIGLGAVEAVLETTARLLKLAPGDARFYFQLASLLSDKGFYEPATRVLEGAHAQWPDSTDAAYNLAVVYFLSGKPAAARSLAEAALRKGERADLFHLLGDIYENLNLYDKAVESYQAALRFDPGGEEYHFALGYEFLIHHNFDLAEQIFSNAAARLPRAVKPRLGLAAAYFAQAKYANAIDTLKAAIGIAPDSELSYAFLGRAFLLLSDHEDLFAGEWTAQTFRAYMKLTPTDPFPHYLAAVSQRGNRSESMRLLRKVLDLDPKFPEAYLELGKIYFDTERYPEAVEAFEKAAHLKPSAPEAHYRLSRAYAKSGNAEKARQTSQLFLKLQKEQETQAVQREKEILRFIYTVKQR